MIKSNNPTQQVFAPLMLAAATAFAIATFRWSSRIISQVTPELGSAAAALGVGERVVLHFAAPPKARATSMRREQAYRRDMTASALSQSLHYVNASRRGG